MKIPNQPQCKLGAAVRSAFALSLMSLFVATAPAQSPAPSTGATGDPDPSASEAEAEPSFIEQAAQSGRKQVRISQLAMSRANASDVRRFADELVGAQQRTNARLAEVANRKGIRIPLSTSSASMRMEDQDNPGATEDSSSAEGGIIEFNSEAQEAMDELSKNSGTAFDRAYLKMVVEDQREAIGLFESEAKENDDPELQSYAQDTLPALREQLNRAEELQRELATR